MCRERKGKSQRTGRSIRDHSMLDVAFFHLGGLSWSEGKSITNKSSASSLLNKTYRIVNLLAFELQAFELPTD